MTYEEIKVYNNYEKMLVGHYLAYLNDYYEYYMYMKMIGANHPRDVPDNKKVADLVENLQSKEAFFLMPEFKKHSAIEIIRQAKDILDEKKTDLEQLEDGDYSKFTFLSKRLNRKLSSKLEVSGTFWKVNF